MRPVKIVFFINPNSGADNKINPAEIIKNFMASHKISFTINELEKDTSPVKVRGIIKNIRPEIAVAAGGDGTVNLIASAVIGLDVKLGILPLGSANGLAFELEIPMKIEDALQNIISGEAKPLDAVKINDWISLHLSDFGMNARVIKEFEEGGKRGFKSYFKYFFKVLNTPKLFRCIIETPGKIYIHKALMTVIANSGSYRSGAVINPTGKRDDGRFEIIVIRPKRHWIIRNTIAAFTGKFHNQSNIATYECTTAQIQVRPMQELQIDGEPQGRHTTVNADIIKHALQIIVPNPQNNSL